jgi:endonuclease YncB( thermonuclease family)
MFRPLVAFCFGFVPICTASADDLAGPISAEVLKIVDGDTIKVRATIWVDQTVEVSVRLRGIDAPELYRPKCDAEKRLARIAKASVSTTSPVGSIVQLSNIKRDKYGGRVIASVSTDDGETLASRLLAQGNAIAYGAPKPWCS